MVRDINFFAPYIKQQEMSSTEAILTGVAAVVLVGITGTLGYNMFQLNTLKNDITSVTINISNPEFVAQHTLAQEVRLERGLLQGYNSALMTVHDGIIDRSIIDIDIVKQINSTVPSCVYLKSLSIQGGSITINAISKNDKEIADFKYNLDKLPIIRESFIPAISSDFGSPAEYSFSITCVLEEVQ